MARHAAGVCSTAARPAMTEFEVKLEVPPRRASRVRAALERLDPKSDRLRAIYWDVPGRLLQRERERTANQAYADDDERADLDPGCVGVHDTMRFKLWRKRAFSDSSPMDTRK